MGKRICPSESIAGTHGDYLRRRSRSMGITMMVMGASFALYYLGLFGGVPGPLEPERLGSALAAAGMTRRHVPVVLLSILIVAGTWNWLYNLVGAMTGRRMTCTGPGANGIGLCGEAVRRQRAAATPGGRSAACYVCSRGHQRAEARFHPVRKGTVSHCLWVTALVFCMMTVCMG